MALFLLNNIMLTIYSFRSIDRKRRVIMILRSAEVKEIFESLGVDGLYHANTVATACSFLRKGGLLSRAAVEKLGLFQTPQSSDKIDKQVGVWGDIFLDTFDLHKWFARHNYYGPVLFKLSLDILDRTSLSGLRITKTNPKYWNEIIDPNERYFQTIQEVDEHFLRTEAQHMVTFTESADVFPFGNDLISIIIDDPFRQIDLGDAHTDAIQALQEAANEGGVDISIISKRMCPSVCRCGITYQETYASTMKKLFRP